jgi:hypothetical protein
LRRRHRISMVRSTSSLRPISGSILPLRAASLRLVAYFSSALPCESPSRSASPVAPLVVAIAALLPAGLGQAMGDEIDHIEPRDVLHAQEVRGMRLLFTENRHQHVGDRHLFLAARLHVEHRALEDPLEPQRRLHVAVLPGRQPGRGLLDELLEFGLELGSIRPAGLQDLPHFRGIDYREQQVLHGHEFVARLARRGKRIVQAKFEFLT